MPGLRHHHLATLDEYFDLELASERRFEFRDGAILAMSGGSIRHDDVSVNVLTALRNRARAPCRAFGPNLRLATACGVHTYADAGVVCGERDVAKHRGTDTLLNPTVVVEVLSPSTRDYDLGDKRAYYEGTPSIRHILHVEPDRVEVQHHRRTPAGWATDTHTTLDAVLHLEGMDVTVAEIYAA